MLLLLLLCIILPSAATGSSPIETIPGYWAHPFYEGLTAPTSICFGPDGTLFVGGLDSKITAVQDLDGNGVADTSFVVASGYSFPLGLAFNNEGQLFVSSRDLLSCPIDTTQDFVADYIETLYTGFPIGLHQNSGITFDSYGNLFVTSGSVSNAGAQPYLAASILRFSPAGEFIDVFSTGHRNPYDLVFVDGVLFATDNSVSGDSTFGCWAAPDEINRVVYNGDYGFPDCFGAGDCIDLSEYCVPPCGTGDCERGAGCAGSIAPFSYLDPHSAPAGICTAETYPGFNATDVFVALWGQGDQYPPCQTDYGHKVVWFAATAPGVLPFDFATGFESPIDVRMGPDNALYVADFGTGVIYRIIKTSPTAVPVDPPPPLQVRAGPNPAMTAVTVRWGAPAALEARVRVFDLHGRKVADLGNVHAGTRWNLRNEEGERVAPGMYWLRVDVGAQSGSRKLLVIQ